ncbi:SRPBCC family protein [Streptomyces johnsoniae]|uniref:SRPBCC family protein n=1 Tax=Streptomyces johnsoniae TaxID=3075532 RepID=A0ABU2S0J6_9ACTN|nr:SRPBCC family protein [Streptomyces sp. DSM 41886]MDT0442526.1 SRPBCC family protein [Streptomyces sp. DSM 41886]
MTSETVFDISVGTRVPAAPDTVFAYVSDLTRSGEWSPECLGGEWTEGTPAALGSVFTARNHRAADVVSWAPVVRGEWATQCEVVASEAPRVFSWAMRDSSGRAQESVWSFLIEAAAGGSVLTHAFRMSDLTEGMREILAKLSGDEKQQFLSDWSGKLEGDMRRSIARIKAVLESTS